MVGGTFKRPAGAAPLLGMNIGSNKKYDDPAYQAALARLDVVIVGFYPGWRGDKDGSVIRRTVQQMKARNPALKVGQYTVLNEAQDDPAKTAEDDKITKLDAMRWWLRTASGAKTQWTTSYSAYETNFSEWAPADANGDRYPQWLAKRDHAVYFKPVPEFDIWYFDNVMYRSRAPAANWRYDGVNVPGGDPAIEGAFRRGQLAHWNAARTLAPGRMLMGNVDSDMSQTEFRAQLPGGFLEGIMGKSWSLVNQGWPVMMQHYFKTTQNLRAPAMVGFNVHQPVNDYKQFRYAFASCLLGNGHFSFTDVAVGYSSVPWFDEYEVALGEPVEAATLTAWSNGVYRRRYEHAMVLVNPQTTPRTVTLEPGWRRVLARQDPTVNNGQPVTQLTLPAKDGIVLVRR